jgi:cytolysin-activating lysine-acyltransferase
MVKSATTGLQVNETWISTDFSHPHSLMGAVAWLMAHAPYHSQWDLFDFEREIVTPIELKQYRLYHSTNGEPTGFVSWAFISSEVKRSLVNRERPMQLDDWNSGSLLLFYDFIAPFGQSTWIVNDLRCNVFPNEEAFSFRRNLDGSIKKIHKWTGKNRAAETRQRKTDAHLCLSHLGTSPKTHAKA